MYLLCIYIGRFVIMCKRAGEIQVQATIAFKNELPTCLNIRLLEMYNVCSNSSVCVGRVRTTYWLTPKKLTAKLQPLWITFLPNQLYANISPVINVKTFLPFSCCSFSPGQYNRTEHSFKSS